MAFPGVEWVLAVVLACSLTGVGAWVFQPAMVARGSLRRKAAPCESSFPVRGGRSDGGKGAKGRGERSMGDGGGGVGGGKGSSRSQGGNSGAGEVVGSTQPFPSILEPASVTLSVVIPAFNEEQRLPLMLDPALEFLMARSKADRAFTFEVIIVDDGSSDGTGELVMSYVDKYGSNLIRLLTLQPNQGKGAAIRKGMLRGRGQYLLMADADGATEISDYARLDESLRTVEQGGMGVAIGSRAHLEEKSIAQRAFHRTVLMWGMHVCVSVLCTTKVKDTQCGFKLFTRKSAAMLFSNLHLERWAFDIELIQIAQRTEMPICEVAVNWHEVDGSKLIQSKLDVVTTSLTMLRDMLCVRLCYMFGIWKIAKDAATLATTMGPEKTSPPGKGGGSSGAPIDAQRQLRQRKNR